MSANASHLPCFRVMICDQFVDIHAENEDAAKMALLNQIENGDHELSLIVWETANSVTHPTPTPAQPRSKNDTPIS